MGTIEFFEHTADVGMRVRGQSLEDLFQTAAEGVFSYIVANPDGVRALERESVALSADSPAELLAAWLNELIFRCETRHRLYTQFCVTIGDEGKTLQADFAGEPIDRRRHVLDHEVKAVTHHALELGTEGEQWFAELILDI